jgi:hypothetical protein
MKDLTLTLDRGPRQQRRQIMSSGIIRQGQLQQHRRFIISITKPFPFTGKLALCGLNIALNFTT